MNATADSAFHIESIEDLINVAKLCETSEKHNHDVLKLNKIKNSLQKLNRLVGMKSLKESIIYQILFFVQDLHTNEMMHTALMGPPGVGKTTVAKILARIYKDLGFLSRGRLICVTREDLVGQYLGETAIKTKRVLDHALGNVLFIDEAYSLGNGEREDMYAKECIDTLTAFLSENTEDFVCIVAGYEDELHKCFFAGNQGLDRRFPWKYSIDSYNPVELSTIFLNQLRKRSWKFRPGKVTDCISLIEQLITENKHIFSNNGGDIQCFVDTCMMAHSKRVFGSKRKYKRCLLPEDVHRGFALYKKNRKHRIAENEQSTAHMYL